MEIQNIVGTGDIDVEVDIDAIVEDLEIVEARYNPDIYPGAYLRLSDTGPLITLYRTGKYNVTGASSVDELRNTKIEFSRCLLKLGL